MQKVMNEMVALNPTSGFTFIGDPGCDGLGAEVMSIFNAACFEASGDFMLIGGDTALCTAQRTDIDAPCRHAQCNDQFHRYRCERSVFADVFG